jgi:hypothetical protein
MVHSVHYNSVFYNFNQKMHTISILFTVIFLKTLNCYVFRTLLVDHNGGHCELNDSCVHFLSKIVEYVAGHLILE